SKEVRMESESAPTWQTTQSARPRRPGETTVNELRQRPTSIELQTATHWTGFASRRGPGKRKQVSQRRRADLRLKLLQFVEAVVAGGDGNYGKEVGPSRIDVARRVANHADRGFL